MEEQKTGVEINPRITIRFDSHQDMVLRELSGAMNVPISILVRAIILDFLTRNDEVIERIVTGQHKINFQQLIKNEHTGTEQDDNLGTAEDSGSSERDNNRTTKKQQECRQ